MPGTEKPNRSSSSDSHAASPLIPARPAYLAAAIGLAAASRLIEHEPNFTPIGAIALFSGATFIDRRIALLLPLAALLASDLVLGFHILVPVVYACFAFNVVLGFWLRGQRRVVRVAAATLLGSCVFFIVTNAACWALWYPRTLEGLANCYVAAVPFFRTTLLADSFYSVVLFGGLAVAERLVPALRERPLAESPAPA